MQLEEGSAKVWVFAYGSLTSDGWEQQFGGTRHNGAVVSGFRRDFNKKSTRNWGSSANPCPTLGLEQDAAAECIGCVFQLPDAKREAVTEYLRDREGRSIELQEQPISLEDGTRVQAVVAVNMREASTYIGTLSVEERAKMVHCARGCDGTCEKYLQNVCNTLHEIGMVDSYVEEFARLVEELKCRTVSPPVPAETR